jgi:transposase
MDVRAERCCGLDVHKKNVVACLLVGGAGEKPRKEVRSFGTFTRDLESLREWLVGAGCTHVAMESTGSYWVPVYAVLEQAATLEIVVGNAQHLRNVTGRKTDVKDSEWIADLLRHGLIKKSFVPPKDLRQLRELLRYRRSLKQAETAERNRLQKVLETANIKLGSVASDVFGKSGRLMVRALIEGTGDPASIAQLAKKQLRKKIEKLEQALRGTVGEHHRLLLKLQLERVERSEADIGMLDAEIERRLEPYRDAHTRLMEIPGVDWVGAATIVAELGTDMSVFPTDRHAAAWSGVCPGNNETGGRARSAPARKGNVHLKTALVVAAFAASKTRGTYFRDKFFRLQSRRGKMRAAMAIARKILIAAYHVLRTGGRYKDLGATYLDQMNKKRVTASLLSRLDRLGYEVTLAEKPKEAA